MHRKNFYIWAFVSLLQRTNSLWMKICEYEIGWKSFCHSEPRPNPIPSPFCLLIFSFWWKKRDTETKATKIATTAKGLQNYVSRKDYSREKNSTSSNNKRNVTKLKNTAAITLSKTRASTTTVGKYHLNISSRQNYPSHLHI